MSIVRLGLIGAGRWAANYVRTVAAMPEARIVRIARARDTREGLPPTDAEVTTDWRRVTAAADLDAVIIATPPGTHADLTLSALMEGRLPVLVEKPLVMSIEEAGLILDTAKKYEVFVMIEHTHLFHDAFRELKKFCRANGPVKTITTVAGNWGSFRKDAPVLWDWGSHDVAMCLDLLGESPARVAAKRLERRETPDGTGETLALDLAFPGGATAQISLSNLREKKCRSFTVTLAGCSLTYDDLAADKLVLLRSGDMPVPEPIPVVSTPPLTVAVTEFLAAVRAKSTDLSGLRLGVDVTETLWRCQEAMEG